MNIKLCFSLFVICLCLSSCDGEEQGYQLVSQGYMKYRDDEVPFPVDFNTLEASYCLEDMNDEHVADVDADVDLVMNYTRYSSENGIKRIVIDDLDVDSVPLTIHDDCEYLLPDYRTYFSSELIVDTSDLLESVEIDDRYTYRYIIRTNDNKIVSLVQAGVTEGGINRYHYLWALYEKR